MNLVPTARTAAVFLLCLLSRWFSGECSSKTFQLALRESDGSVLCAESPVSQTTPVTDLLITNYDVPPQVVCAYHCTNEAVCHSFNHRSDLNVCQFYHYLPTVCLPTPNCHYFQVHNLIPQIRQTGDVLMFYQK